MQYRQKCLLTCTVYDCSSSRDKVIFYISMNNTRCLVANLEQSHESLIPDNDV
jgi:hypothetical protein